MRFVTKVSLCSANPTTLPPSLSLWTISGRRYSIYHAWSASFVLLFGVVLSGIQAAVWWTLCKTRVSLATVMVVVVMVVVCGYAIVTARTLTDAAIWYLCSDHKNPVTVMKSNATAGNPCSKGADETPCPNYKIALRDVITAFYLLKTVPTLLLTKELPGSIPSMNRLRVLIVACGSLCSTCGQPHQTRKASPSYL